MLDQHISDIFEVELPGTEKVSTRHIYCKGIFDAIRELFAKLQLY